MDATGKRLSVAWCTTPNVRRELEESSLDFSVEWTTPEDPLRDDVVNVLDTRIFGSARALVEACSTRPSSAPALFVCARGEVTQLLGELSDADDLILHDAPTGLLNFRVNRMVGRSADRDSLTGLMQSAVFFSFIKRFRADPARMPLSLLLVDVDHFKRVNDAHGHGPGDAVLKETAGRIGRVAPPDAVVGRVGGEEFGVLGTLSPTDATALADRVRKACAATPMQGIDITVSVGCATAMAPSQALFPFAEEALYAAKAAGRDRVIHYDDLVRRAREQDRDVALDGFENRTRVVAERVAELITRKGRRLFDALREEADIDVLTRLFSRRYLDRRLPFEVELSSDHQTPLTVALLDIDHFGSVNKTHGFPTGDKVLSEVADRIHRNIRAEDWVARYGGEEVCVVMHGTTLDNARPVLERIRSAVAAEPFASTDGSPIKITLSGGAAQRACEETLEAFMERISQKLLLAKRQGRNRVVT